MNTSLNATLFAANKASHYNLKTVNIKLTDKQNQSTSMINSRSNSKNSIKDLDKHVITAATDKEDAQNHITELNEKELNKHEFEHVKWSKE